MLSSKNLGIILLIALILMFVPIPFIGGNNIAAILVLVVAIMLLVKGK